MAAAAFLCARAAAAALRPPSRGLPRRLLASRVAAASASGEGGCAGSSPGLAQASRMGAGSVSCGLVVHPVALGGIFLAGGGGVEFQGKVGFLGLGIMGAPMASNLIRAG